MGQVLDRLSAWRVRHGSIQEMLPEVPSPEVPSPDEPEPLPSPSDFQAARDRETFSLREPPPEAPMPGIADLTADFLGADLGESPEARQFRLQSTLTPREEALELQKQRQALPQQDDLDLSAEPFTLRDVPEGAGQAGFPVALPQEVPPQAPQAPQGAPRVSMQGLMAPGGQMPAPDLEGLKQEAKRFQTKAAKSIERAMDPSIPLRSKVKEPLLAAGRGAARFGTSMAQSYDVFQRKLTRAALNLSFGKDFPAMLAPGRFPGDVPKDLSTITDPESLYMKAGQVAALADEVLAGDPRMAEDFLFSVIPEAGSQMGLFILSRMVAGPAGVVLTGAGLEGSQLFNEILEKSDDPELAGKGWVMGLPLGATELLSIEGIADLSKIPGGAVKKRIIALALSSLEEAGQEFGQQVGSEATARALLKDNRNIFEGSLEGAAAGGVWGFVASSIFQAMTPGRSRGAPPIPEQKPPTPPAPPTRPDTAPESVPVDIGPPGRPLDMTAPPPRPFREGPFREGETVNTGPHGQVEVTKVGAKKVTVKPVSDALAALPGKTRIILDVPELRAIEIPPPLPAMAKPPMAEVKEVKEARYVPLGLPRPEVSPEVQERIKIEAQKRKTQPVEEGGEPSAVQEQVQEAGGIPVEQRQPVIEQPEVQPEERAAPGDREGEGRAEAKEEVTETPAVAITKKKATPSVYVKPEDVETKPADTFSGPGKRLQHKESGELLNGEAVTKEQLPEVLYHVTTNASAIEETGIISGSTELKGGLGKGTSKVHQGVSFTRDRKTAVALKRDLDRTIRMAKKGGRKFKGMLTNIAKEDEKLHKLKPGTLDKARDATIEWFEMHEKTTKDKNALAAEAFSNNFLNSRQSQGGIENPVIFSGPEFGKLDPKNVSIIAVPSRLIPEGVLIRNDPIKALAETMASGDVPIEGATVSRPPKVEGRVEPRQAPPPSEGVPPAPLEAVQAKVEQEITGAIHPTQLPPSSAAKELSKISQEAQNAFIEEQADKKKTAEEKAQAAMDRIRGRSGPKPSTILGKRGRKRRGAVDFDPNLRANIRDAMIWGGYRLKALGHGVAGKVVSFAQFSKEMLDTFGDSIKPHLRDIYDTAKKIAVGEGTPERAGTTESEEARSFEVAHQEMLVREGKPERQSRKPLEEEADKAVQDDFEGARAMFREKAEKSEGTTALEQLIGMRVADKSAQKAIQSGTEEDIHNAILDFGAHKVTGTELGRALSARRDRYRTPEERLLAAQSAIKKAIFEPHGKMEKVSDKRFAILDHKIKELFNELQNAGSGKEYESILEQIRALESEKFQLRLQNKTSAKEAKKMIDWLKAQGLDPARFYGDAGLELLKTEAGKDDSLRLVNQIHAYNASLTAAWREWYINSILSAPKTAVVNILGFGNVAWELGPKRFMTASFNLIKHDPTAPAFKDYKVMAKAFWPSLQRAYHNGLRSWATETAMFEEEVAGKERAEAHLTRFELRGPAIKGRRGRWFRIPTRILLASDEFMKTLLGNALVGVQADKIARMEGLSPSDKTSDKYERRVQELMSNVGSKAWNTALLDARDFVFQKEAGPVTKVVMRDREKLGPVGWLTVPFVMTPTNIFKKGIRATPVLGSATRGAYFLIDKKKGTYTRSSLNDDLAAEVLSWATLFLVAPLIDPGDDKEPLITGTTSFLDTSMGEKVLRFSNLPPSSIRIPLTNRWVSYARLEPFATALGLTVDMVAEFFAVTKHDKDVDKALDDFLKKVRGQLTEKTYLQGIGDTLKLLFQRGKPSDNIVAYIGNLVGAHNPNFIKAAARASDPVFRDNRAFAQKPGGSNEIGEILARWTLGNVRRALPLPALASIPRRHPLSGRELTRKELDGPVWLTDFPFRLMSPVRSVNTARDRSPTEIKIDRAILNWNMLNPNREKWRQGPSHWFQDKRGEFGEKGKTYKWTAKEYDQLQKEAGETAYAILEKSSLIKRLDPINPREIRLDSILKLITARRKAAKQKILRSRREAQRSKGLTHKLPLIKAARQ